MGTIIDPSNIVQNNDYGSSEKTASYLNFDINAFDFIEGKE
jgi:hypothetical protein